MPVWLRLGLATAILGLSTPGFKHRCFRAREPERRPRMAGAETLHGANPDFLRACLAELRRVVNSGRDSWTVASHLPVVPHAAQLCTLARLVLKGVGEHDVEVFKYREKLDSLLAKAHAKAKGEWEAGLTKGTPAKRNKHLNDAEAIRVVVNKAVNFAKRSFSLHDMPLTGFTENVQDTLAGLVGKFSEAMEAKLGTVKAGGGAGGVPGAVEAAIGLGLLAGGFAGRRVMTAKELSAARVLARLGAEKDEAGGPEPKEVKRLRGTLKELAAHLPEQRA